MDMKKGKKLLGMLTYSAADTLGGGVGQVISIYYLTFLTFVAGLPPALAGLVTGIGKIWDGISDPIMGVVVDRTRTKIGSCRPYFLIALIPVFFTYFMLWYGWGINGTVAKFFYYAIAYMLFSTAYTIAIVPYEALLPRMVDSYSERTDYSSLRMIFSGVGCVASTYIYEMIIPANEAPSPALQPNFIILGLVLGAFFALPLLITFFGTKETIRENLSSKLTLREVFKDYKEVLSNKSYRKYYALNLAGAFVGAAISASSAMFVYLFFGNVADFLLGFTLLFLVVNLKGAIEIGFFPVNVFVMKKYNKHRPYLIDLPMIVAAGIIALFVTPNTPIWVFLIACGLMGGGVSCLGFVPMTLLPDLTDVDELMYGKRREGTNAGLTTMGKKIVSGLALTLFGFILQAFGLESTTASPETATVGAQTAVKLMYAVIPIVFAALMVVISRTYSLDKNSHALIKSLINKKRNGEEILINDEDATTIKKLTGKNPDSLWIGRKGE